jgi:hypothetical protein
VFDMSKEGHADDGVDEGDEGEEGTDVEERRQGHDQGKEQLTDALGRLDEEKGKEGG